MRFLQWVYDRVPPRLRERPLAMLAMMGWFGAGVELFRSKWPLDMWPSVIDLTRVDDSIAYYGFATMITLSGLLWLIGAFTPHTARWGSFLIWLSLWISLSISLGLCVMVAGIFITDRYIYPEVIIAAGFWGYAAIIFAVALRHEHDLAISAHNRRVGDRES